MTIDIVDILLCWYLMTIDIGDNDADIDEKDEDEDDDYTKTIEFQQLERELLNLLDPNIINEINAINEDNNEYDTDDFFI